MTGALTLALAHSMQVPILGAGAVTMGLNVCKNNRGVAPKDMPKRLVNLISVFSESYISIESITIVSKLQAWVRLIVSMN